MENFKLTVTKEGEIIVDFGVADEIVIKQYIKLFEEVIGPVREITIPESDGIPVTAKFIDKEREKEKEKEKFKSKRRIK